MPRRSIHLKWELTTLRWQQQRFPGRPGSLYYCCHELSSALYIRRNNLATLLSISQAQDDLERDSEFQPPTRWASFVAATIAGIGRGVEISQILIHETRSLPLFYDRNTSMKPTRTYVLFPKQLLSDSESVFHEAFFHVFQNLAVSRGHMSNLYTLMFISFTAE